eukprot:UN03906
MGYCFPCCTHAFTMGDIDENCFMSFCCFPCCACCDVNKIEDKLLGRNSGVFMNWVLLYFCGCCMITRNRRAVTKWLAAGKPNAANSVRM